MRGTYEKTIEVGEDFEVDISYINDVLVVYVRGYDKDGKEKPIYLKVGEVHLFLYQMK